MSVYNALSLAVSDSLEVHDENCCVDCPCKVTHHWQLVVAHLASRVQSSAVEHHNLLRQLETSEGDQGMLNSLHPVDQSKVFTYDTI